MGAPIPIQAPHIDPQLFQRPAGGEEGLAPLIQALEFYKSSKLEEQRNQIEAGRAASTSALQGAQQRALEEGMRQKKDEQQAWSDFVSNAPASIQPILKGIDAMRGLPPELQQVAGPMVSKAIAGQMGLSQAPDHTALTTGLSFFKAGVPMNVAFGMVGLHLADETTKGDPDADPNAIYVPKKVLNMTYSPPGAANSDLSRRLRAQSAIVTDSQKQLQQLQKDIAKQQQQIADEAWKTANPKAPPPLQGVKYDPSDQGQVRAFHQYLIQRGIPQRMQRLQADQAAAMEEIKRTGLGAASDSSPAEDQLQQVINLMGAAPDSSQQ